MKAISEDDVQKAVDWLRDNAEACAKARATRIYLEEYRKSIKALLMKNIKTCLFLHTRKERLMHMMII